MNNVILEMYAQLYAKYFQWFMIYFSMMIFEIFNKSINDITNIVSTDLAIHQTDEEYCFFLSG